MTPEQCRILAARTSCATTPFPRATTTPGAWGACPKPGPELEQQAADALGPDPLDDRTLTAAREYGLPLRAYEHLFRDTLGG